MVATPAVLLVDNGSKRAASVLSLRAAATALAALLGGEAVLPVSLKYSDTIAPASLGGVRARTLQAELEALAAGGERRAVIAPLFLGPSGAFRDGVAACADELQRAGTPMELHVGECLVPAALPSDDRVARALAALVLRQSRARRLAQPLKVVVVDHGTPSASVNAVRARLAAEVDEMLGDRAAAVGAASMERRDGEAYDFNEPLLETLLATPPFDSGDVVLAMAFLSPGRHAGEGGDIAQIVEAATAARPDLRVHITPLLATQSLVAAVLRDRVEAAAAAPPLQVE